jgi:hypothetical protein
MCTLGTISTVNIFEGGVKLALNIVIRPELKTSNGEVSDLFVKDEYIGTMSLVYRESDRLHGAVQIDPEQISEYPENEIVSYIQSYIHSLVEALDIELCEVLVTYGGYQYIIDEDWLVDKFSSEDQDDYEPLDEENEFELVMIAKERHRIKFQVKQLDGEFVAKATVKFYENKIVSTLNFRNIPTQIELEQIAFLITDFFQEEKTDLFRFKIKVNGKHIDTMKFAVSQSFFLEKNFYEHKKSKQNQTDKLTKEKYDIQLIRDDGDALTYEIYKNSYTKTFLGTATIDIAKEQLTGYIDFKNHLPEIERELVATCMLEELDKVRDYEKVNLSMFVRNECIDEILFENEEVSQ